MEVFDQFNKDVETDINKGVQLLNIDYYMRDLKKHAIEEYDEVLKIEQKLIIESDIKKGSQVVPIEDNKLLNIRYGLSQSKDQNLINNDALYTEQINNLTNPNLLVNEMFDLSMLDAKEKKKLKKKQRKRDKKVKQQMAQHGLLVDDGNSNENDNENENDFAIANDWNLDFMEGIK